MKLENVLLAAPVLSLLFLSGCTHNRVNLKESKAIVLKVNAPKEINLTTDVFGDDGNLVVLGRVGRGALDLRKIPGHIDIIISNASGEVVSTVKARFRDLSTWRHGPSPVAFRTEFPGLPPENSVVEVTYHTERHD